MEIRRLDKLSDVRSLGELRSLEILSLYGVSYPLLSSPTQVMEFFSVHSSLIALYLELRADVLNTIFRLRPQNLKVLGFLLASKDPPDFGESTVPSYVTAC